MSEKNDNMLIADTIHDEEVRRFLYLDLSIDELITTLNGVVLSNIGDEQLTPFFAKVRGYTGAHDADGDPWLVKEIPEEEGPSHKIQEIAYYVDFLLKTPAAPTILLRQDGKVYRATKLITSAMQIGSYNYLEQPFIKMLANDLLNRWLFFDEDRNPNNYLVRHDTDGEPYVVVIDYNKADLEHPEMKITGTDDHFGWYREEKTRFLTLLKPENFQVLSIDDFEQRLALMTAIEESELFAVCRKVFSDDIFDDPDGTARTVASNLVGRIAYLNGYFRTWFKERNISKEEEVDDRYSGLGQSFLNYYKRKT